MTPPNPPVIESSCPLPHLPMENSSLSTTLAVTATVAAALGSAATAYFLRRYGSRRRVPSRSRSTSIDDLEYCSAREVSSDSSEHGVHSKHIANDRSSVYSPRSKLRWENDAAQDVNSRELSIERRTSAMPDTQQQRQRRQILDYSNRSSESEASSLPSDEWFENLVSDHAARCSPPSDDIEAEEFHNKSGSSEYIDRVGSLHHVRRSILKRASMLAGNIDDYDEGHSDDDYEEPSSDVMHESDIPCETISDSCNRRTLSESTITSASCSCSQSTPVPHKYRRPSYEPQRIFPRRRSSAHNHRRRFSKTGTNPTRSDLERASLCDSITTCGEDDDDAPRASFSFDAAQTQQSPFGRRPKAYTEEDSYISETERQFKGEEGFETAVTELAHDFPSSLRLLRRTRAISALAHRLMAAPDEAACIEEVTRLMVLIFGLNRVSFAMTTGSDHFLLKRIEVRRKPRENGGDEGAAGSLDSVTSSNARSLDLVYLDSDFKRPFEGTAAGVVVKTLKEHYTPRTEFSDFPTHKVFYKQGLNSVLASPILVNGNQCMGVILLSKPEEDAFPKADRVLISDIATLLGANIYSKRLRKASEEANKLSREMLHSFVPPKVLEKIEGFWDSNSAKYRALRSSVLAQESNCTPESSVGDKSSNEEEVTRSNSWYVANQDWSEAQIQEHARKMKNGGVQDKLHMLKKLNRGESFNGEDSTGVIITTKGLDLDAELNMTSRALYAENVHNVTIIFTDIVGFSRIAMGVTPIKVMNMLQNLFNRFDRLCDVHGVMKLETIGDAYLCATNLLEEDANDVNVARDAAVRALAMAKDMVREARHVRIPVSHEAVHIPWASHTFDEPETLEIRVGIHVGDITCGVLGQRLPKFTICGTTVNLAARMEQTSKPSMIRVTKGFHDLVGDNEDGWLKKETVALKNMGKVETYLLDPFRISMPHSEA